MTKSAHTVLDDKDEATCHTYSIERMRKRSTDNPCGCRGHCIVYHSTWLVTIAALAAFAGLRHESPLRFLQSNNLYLFKKLSLLVQLPPDANTRLVWDWVGRPSSPG